MSAVLIIAGCDSSGGAGITRDVATLERLGARALCAVTAVTVQTDSRFIACHAVPADTVAAQIAAALGRYQAVKIGMLVSAAVAQAVARSLAQAAPLPIVLDPVLTASSGGSLLDRPGITVLREQLLPAVTLLTPNLPEAALLLGSALAEDEATVLAQAQALLQLGPAAVLIKGGHGRGDCARDLLLVQGEAPRWFSAPRLPGTLRGSGCALSSAIAAHLGAGLSLPLACAQAKEHVTGLLRREA